MQVSRRKKIIVEPKAPSFPVSPQITVRIGQAEHAVVYGPYHSPDDQHSLFPYAHDAGQKFHSKKYLFHLASNSRIMNPLHDPKTSDNGNNRADYFARQKVNQKSASSIQKQILETMCGGSMAEETPELFGELQKLLGENGVCFCPFACIDLGRFVITLVGWPKHCNLSLSLYNDGCHQK